MSAPQITTNCSPPLPKGTFDIKTRATAQARGKKCHSYKPLASRFRRDAIDYRQIAREGDAAIYEQTWCGCSDPSVCYEVVRIRRREGFQITAEVVREDERGREVNSTGKREAQQPANACTA